MTKQTEALKLALEALNSFPTKHLTPFISSARTAIREALASGASEESSGTGQPAQPQQEPVAWASMLPNEAIGIVTWSKDTAKAWASKGHIIKELSFTSPPAPNQCKFPLCQNEDYQQALAEQIKQELYTGEPAQREPLTDDEIMAIGKELGLKCRLGGNPNIDFDYARAIEAAHGIKGDA